MSSVALDQLATDLAAVSFVQGTETTPDHEGTLAHARRLLDVKLRFEAGRAEGAAPIVVVAGGTNVGKSTVFNWIVGDAIASSSPLARHTKAPTILVHEDDAGGLREGALLPSYRRVASQNPQDATQEPRDGQTSYFLRLHALPQVRGVVLVDCPDIDSTHANNRAVAEDLLFLADAVVFVATPEKYNDDLCVRYLRQATGLGKSLVCALNKGADEAVARDFQDVVVPGLGGAPVVVTLPYVPRPDPRAGEWREALRAVALRAREDAPAVRRAARRGAAAALGEDVARVASRLREELSELDRIRSEVSLALDARRDEYQAFLRDLDFYELDRVYERVLDYFKIPVVDAVYDGFRGAVGFVTSGLASIFSGRQARDSRTVKLEARAEVDRQRVKGLIDKARAEALDMPYRHTGTLRSAAAGWTEGLAAPSIEEQNLEVQVFAERAEAESERWIEAQTRHHVTFLEAHPYARNALRTVKGVFQIGFGLVSAKLTGGFGPWDVLIGTATERATKSILEGGMGVVHYQALKAEFTAQRARLFREHLERAVAEPLRQRVPQGVDPERLERLDLAAADLRRGAFA